MPVKKKRNQIQLKYFALEISRRLEKYISRALSNTHDTKSGRYEKDFDRVVIRRWYARRERTMLCNDDVVAPRYKKRKQREQTVIKAPAREQPNDVATSRILSDGNLLE